MLVLFHQGQWSYLPYMVEDIRAFVLKSPPQTFMKMRMGVIWAHVKSRPEGKGTTGHLIRTELRPAWCSATVHWQTSLAVAGISHLTEVALL